MLVEMGIEEEEAPFLGGEFGRLDKAILSPSITTHTLMGISLDRLEEVGHCVLECIKE